MNLPNYLFKITCTVNEMKNYEMIIVAWLNLHFMALMSIKNSQPTAANIVFLLFLFINLGCLYTTNLEKR